MGLLGGIVKTAVVAGTSQAVRGRVARRQAENLAERDQAIARTRGEGWAEGSQAARGARPPAAAGGSDPVIVKLQQLAELRDQGILSDAEFEAQKDRILAQRG
jgi:hypothetical protein